MNAHLIKILIGISVILFVIIPLTVSVIYGNSPLMYSLNYQNTRLNNNDSQNPSVMNQQSNRMTQPATSNINPNTVQNIVYMNPNNQMTFRHVLRDELVLIFVAILAIILDRMFGNHFLRSIRRRF